MVELYLHSPIRLHGVVLNELSTGQLYLYLYVTEVGHKRRQPKRRQLLGLCRRMHAVVSGYYCNGTSVLGVGEVCSCHVIVTTVPALAQHHASLTSDTPPVGLFITSTLH
jgi:hypothetical protein